ncbi:hypothetical protein ACFV2B_38440, partial [Streptomyces lavendulae]
MPLTRPVRVRPALLAAGSAALLALTAAVPSAAAPAPPLPAGAGSVVLDWYDTTAPPGAATAGPTQLPTNRSGAIGGGGAGRGARGA